jgi:hypothetical protein
VHVGDVYMTWLRLKVSSISRLCDGFLDC